MSPQKLCAGSPPHPCLSWRTNSENQLKKTSRDHPARLPNFQQTGVLVTNLQVMVTGWSSSGTHWSSHGQRWQSQSENPHLCLWCMLFLLFCFLPSPGRIRGGFLFSVDFCHSAIIHIPSVYPSMHPFIHPSIYPNIHLPIHLSIHLPSSTTNVY